MEDAPGAKAVLRSTVAGTGLTKLVRDRHAYIVVEDLAVVAVAAPDRHAPHDVHAGRILRHDDLCHFAVPVGGPVGIFGTAHDDEEMCPLAVRREPLVAVDHPLVAVASRRRLY